jgi:hypothetical protein
LSLLPLLAQAQINPLFPAYGPATGPFNGLHAKSKFLAAPLPGSPGEKQ